MSKVRGFASFGPLVVGLVLLDIVKDLTESDLGLLASSNMNGETPVAF